MTRDMVLNKNKIKRHKGYRILAIDGSELRLDKTKENKDIFLPRNHSPENKKIYEFIRVKYSKMVCRNTVLFQ